MHELQFMTNLVRMVEEVCKKESRITPSIITLQVASDSHLAQHIIEDLQTMFDFVSRNTLAQGAKLAVTTKTRKPPAEPAKLQWIATLTPSYAPTAVLLKSKRTKPLRS